LAEKAVEYSLRKGKYSDFVIQLLTDSFKEWELGNLDKAIQKCNNFIALQPDMLFGKLLKSLILTSQKRHSESEDLLDSIPTQILDANESQIRNFLKAMNLFYTDKFVESIEYSNEFIKYNAESNRTIYVIRGFANASLENHVQAIMDFKVALKDNLEIEGIKANLAYSYLKNGNHFKSLLMYRKIVKHFPCNLTKK